MTDKKIWQPSDGFKKNSKMYEFIHIVVDKYNLKDYEYETVHQWSVLNPYAFGGRSGIIAKLFIQKNMNG